MWFYTSESIHCNLQPECIAFVNCDTSGDTVNDNYTVIIEKYEHDNLHIVL